MKSQTSQVARSCRIREWASMVQECRNRPNGMSVDEWCQANNITKANYYYRFAQVRKACLDSIPSNAVKHAIIPVPTELMHTEPESTAVDSNSALIQDSFFYTNVWNKVSSYKRRNESEVQAITSQQFRWLMEGLTITPKKTVQEVAPPTHMA